MSMKHVAWARKIQSIAQIGLEYATDPCERERYQALRALAAEVMAKISEVPTFQWLELFGKEIGYVTPKVDVRGAIFRGS